MTPSQLLIPRYECVAPPGTEHYPGSPYKVGEIIELNHRTSEGLYWSKYTKESPYHWEEETIGRYPHLFRRKEWWEDRSTEDMPDYIKTGNGVVVEVDKTQLHKTHFKAKGGALLLFLNTRVPATKEEYDQYISSKQPKL